MKTISMLIPKKKDLYPDDLNMIHVTKVGGKITEFSFVRTINLAYDFNITLCVKLRTSKNIYVNEILSDDTNILIKSKRDFNDLKKKLRLI